MLPRNANFGGRNSISHLRSHEIRILMVRIRFRTYGECSREIEFRWSRLAASIAAKCEFRWSRLRRALPRNANFGGRAYGGCCREMRILMVRIRFRTYGECSREMRISVVEIRLRTYGECSHKIRISMVAPAAGIAAKCEFRWSRLAASIAVKSNSDGRA